MFEQMEKALDGWILLKTNTEIDERMIIWKDFMLNMKRIKKKPQKKQKRTQYKKKMK